MGNTQRKAPARFIHLRGFIDGQKYIEDVVVSRVVATRHVVHLSSRLGNFPVPVRLVLPVPSMLLVLLALLGI